MTQITTTDLSTLDPQTAYLIAAAAYQIELEARSLITAPLHAAVDAGTMTSKAYFAAMARFDAEDAAGSAYWSAREARHVATDALLAWGRTELHRAWKQHSRQLPGVSLDMLDALFDNYTLKIRTRLIELVLKLDVVA